MNHHHQDTAFFPEYQYPMRALLYSHPMVRITVATFTIITSSSPTRAIQTLLTRTPHPGKYWYSREFRVMVDGPGVHLIPGKYW
jgi:hypothetical protein